MKSPIAPIDIVLILGVSALVTVVAFVHRPRLKALIFSIPIPFTLANLALGAPVGPTHIAGILNLLLFLNVVRWLHVRIRAPIVAATILSALLYIGVGIVLNRIIPDTNRAFLLCSLATFAVAGAASVAMRARAEPGQRSDLPIPLKFSVVALVVTLIVILKNQLGGFMTTFPLAGVVTVYETRRSLWTLCRQATVMALAMASMIIVMRVLQQSASVPVWLSLAPGWAAWSAVMIPTTIVRWRREDRNLAT